MGGKLRERNPDDWHEERIHQLDGIQGEPASSNATGFACLVMLALDHHVCALSWSPSACGAVIPRSGILRLLSSAG